MSILKSNTDALFNLFQHETNRLEQVVRDYPASSLARLLLLKKYKESNHPGFEKLKSESALYMSNVPWYLLVLHQLESEGTGTDQAEAGVMTQESAGNEIEVQSPIQEQEEIAETEAIEEEGTNTSSTAIIEDTQTEGSEDIEGVVESEAENTEEPEVEELVEEALSTETAEDVHQDDEHLQEIENIENEAAEVNEATEEDSDVPSPEETEVVASGETEPEAEEKPVVGSEVSEGINSPVFSGIDLKNATLKEVQDDEMVFEPLYTVDYFASQGIKLSEEMLKDDKLSQQVKSFTGWLKSMKKLHPTKLPEQNEVIERIIQNAAEMSNVETDVLTEAMAEVLVKQNKKDKAIEMYHKLSLMNPSKSAYFAAKIENLKST